MATSNRLRVLLACALLSGALAGTTACLEDKGQRLASVSDAVVLSGLTVDASGEPLADVNVTVELDAQILATSGADGRFQLTLPRTKIGAITSTLSFQRKTYFLYFEHTARNLLSVSAPISLDDIGDKSLGLIVLSAPGSITGKGMRADAGQVISPAQGSTITVGPVSGVVAADGSFALTRVPSGRVPLTLTAAGARPYYAELDIAAGQSRALEDPCIAFAGVGPLGVVVEKAGRPLAELVASGHATAKHFRVYASDETRFVRVHHDLSVLQALEAQAAKAAATGLGLQSTGAAETPAVPGGVGATAADLPWLSVATDLDYDFPANGGHVLYYQFTDFTKTKLSRIYQVGVDVDVFADSDGFQAANASPLADSRVRLTVDTPVAAISMRFAEDPKELANLPWSPVSADSYYDFHPTDADPTSGGEPILRRLYGQFRDAFGHDSRIYVTLIEMRLFPGLELVVGDGSGVVTSQVVPVSLNVPIDALFMRSAESAEDLKKAVWQAASETSAFRFAPLADAQTSMLSISGPRQVCYQLKDRNGFVSQAVCSNVDVDLFGPASDFGFTINGGSLVSTSLIVDLAISVPPNATSMRIFESAADSSTTITESGTASIYTVGGGRNTVAEKEWLPASDTAFFTFATAGTKTLVVQFRTAGNLVSASYTQPITVLPLEESYRSTDVIVNGGAPVAVGPTITVDILSVPASASAMMVSTTRPTTTTGGFTSSDDQLDGVWEPVAAQTQLEVSGKGPKTIYVQFRNNDGQLSPVFKRTVLYDPFPSDLVSIEAAVDGSTTDERDVRVSITAPPTAAAMRIATEINAVANAPYEPFQADFSYTLPAVAGSYRLYVQLKAPNGDESLIFSSAAVALNPFPVADLTAVISGAPATVTSRTIQLQLTAPSIATEMRLSTSLNGVAGEAWQAFQGSVDYTLPAVAGSYRIYVQVRTGNGTESTVFASSEAITYDPFPVGSVSVVANGGTPTTTDRDLPLAITAPVIAAQMRIAATPEALAAATWVPFAASTSLSLPNADGSYRAYVQVRTADGTVSQVVQSDEVTLDVP